ncbi:MAG: hypothetical protein IJ423_05545 [Clostridia bacterium]|nr:hypothetical protein [Clostridia bacterium]MBQ8637434.1 hypothetical protein [Clostridia bacterium]
MKDFEFGTHIHIPAQAIDISEGVTSYVSKIAVQIQETVDKAIIDEIVKAANEQSLTDVYVLNKQNITAAIRKQMPVKPDYEGDYDYAKCPACGHDDFEYGVNNWGCNHCPKCGQALDWSDVE